MKSSEEKIVEMFKQIKSRRKNLSKKCLILQHIMVKEEAHIKTLQLVLNMSIQTITARLSELEDLGVIYKTRTALDGKHSMFAIESDPCERLKNRLSREKIKFEKWKKCGLMYFDRLLNEDVKQFLNN